MTLTKEEVLSFFHETIHGFDDDERFCRESLTVLNERGQLVPMRWRPAQHKLNEAIRGQVARGLPVRIIIDKARQVGFSTATAASFFKRTPFLDGQHTLVIAHEGTASVNLFDYYKRFKDHYTPFLGTLELPELVTDREGKLEWENDSYIQIATANNVKTGRSFTYRRVHLSEFAFYRDAGTLMTGLLQAVPDDPDTIIIIESTANGLGGPFYEKWEEASSGKGDSEWIPLFFAWFEEPRYRLKLRAAPDLFQDSLTDHEWELKQRYGLDLEQLHWRRWAIANKCEGDERRFRQEYPSTAEESFLVSGRPRFDPLMFTSMPLIDGQVGGLATYRIGTRDNVLRFEPRERGELTIFKKPDTHREYILGADTADGQDATEGTGTPDPDYSVGQVLERDMGEQVAILRERLEPVAFGYYLFELGRYYNWAYLVIEVGGSTYGAGLATINEVLRLGYPIDRIYHRRTVDETTRAVTAKIGWMTKPNTKSILISTLDRALIDHDLILHDKTTIRECHSFVIKANGKTEAQQGSHDDTVIALALAELGRCEAPRAPERLRNQARKIMAPKPYGRTQREQQRGTLYKPGARR